MGHCDDSLRKIGRAIIAYQKENDYHNPAGLQELVDLDLITCWELVCPAASFPVGESSYEYRGADLYADVLPDMILAYDRQANHKGRRNILFADGRVERPPEKYVSEIIAKDNECRRQLELTEKPFK